MIPGTKICQKDLLWLTVIVFWFIFFIFIFSVVLKESSFFRSLWPMDYLCRKTSEGHIMLKKRAYHASHISLLLHTLASLFQEPEIGSFFFFCVQSIFSDNFLFFRTSNHQMAVKKWTWIFVHLHLNSDFDHTNSGLSLPSSFEQHVPEFNQKFTFCHVTLKVLEVLGLEPA